MVTRETSISEGLRALRAEAASFELPSEDVSGSRALLTRILADREFQGIHGPTAIDRLKQRIQRFFSWLLGRALRSSAIPTISRVLVNVLIGLAVLIVAYLMYRALRRTAVLETAPLNTPPRSVKEWTLWLKEARGAANTGCWRDAIHFVYWCGIAFLEAQGVWRPDRARTPREYLRLLPPSSEYLQTLTTLTSGFERVWYGTEDANAERFAQALTDLKKLGCPSS